MAEQYRLENYKAKRERAHKNAYTGPSAMYIWFLIRRVLAAALGIRIRIRMFLGLADPDLLVRGTNTDPDPSPFSHKCVERTKIMPAK